MVEVMRGFVYIIIIVQMLSHWNVCITTLPLLYSLCHGMFACLFKMLLGRFSCLLYPESFSLYPMHDL